MRGAFAVLVALLLVLIPASANADRNRSGGGTVGTGQTEFIGAGDSSNGDTHVNPGISITGSTTVVESHTENVCFLGGLRTCAEPQRCDGTGAIMTQTTYVFEDGSTTVQYNCPTDSVATPPVQITNAMVARAFKRIPLPASKLVVQPPGGETLVNFDTNFYTEAEPFERSVTLVGQRIDLRIWPSSFGWSFGDGAETRTEEPGSAYPDLEITHAYLEAGRVGPSVDTTYSAEFRVNGGAWRPVVGTVTMEGEPVGLQVRTATPTLVGYR